MSMWRLSGLLVVVWLMMSPLRAEGSLPDLLSEVSESDQWSKAQASSFLAFLLADGKFQSEEVSWLEKLSASSEPLKLSLEGHDYVLPTPQGEARALLGLMARPPNLNVLFDGSSEQFGQLVDISGISPALRDRTGGFLITRFTQALTVSELSNAYTPLRALLEQAVRKCDGLDQERRKAGRVLIWQCCQGMRDGGLKDKDGQVIQKFVYDWILLR